MILAGRVGVPDPDAPELKIWPDKVGKELAEKQLEEGVSGSPFAPTPPAYISSMSI